MVVCKENRAQRETKGNRACKEKGGYQDPTGSKAQLVHKEIRALAVGKESRAHQKLKENRACREKEDSQDPLGSKAQLAHKANRGKQV